MTFGKKIYFIIYCHFKFCLKTVNYYRHAILFKAAARRFVDAKATVLYGILHKLWHEKSPPIAGQSKFVTFNEIHDAVRKNTELSGDVRETLLQFLDQYLKLFGKNCTLFKTN